MSHHERPITGATPVPALPSIPSPALPASIGRYRVGGLLGRGGMGIVYLAHDDRLGRDVAVKMLKPEFAVDGETAVRFAAEARALARITHPNIVRIFDLVEGAPQPAYAMEHLQGRSLSRALRGPVGLPPSTIRDVLLQSAAALGAVHRAGMVHRDIKPSNLFLAEEDDHVVVKLIDFGIALQRGNPRVTRPGEVIGTVRYMAPEQLVAGVLDARTDVFAWGIVANELVPAQARSPAFAVLLDRCVRVDPQQRCSDMREVAEQLSSLLDDAEDSTLTFGVRVVPRMGGTVRLAPSPLPANPGATERVVVGPHAVDAPTSHDDPTQTSAERVHARWLGRASSFAGGVVFGVGAILAKLHAMPVEAAAIASSTIVPVEASREAAAEPTSPGLFVLPIPTLCGSPEPPITAPTSTPTPAVVVPTPTRRKSTKPAMNAAPPPSNVITPPVVPALPTVTIPIEPPPPTRTRSAPHDLKEPFAN